MDKAIMLKRLTRGSITWGCLLILSGCVYDDEPMPKIVEDYSRSRIVTPPTPRPPQRPKRVDENIPRGWIPPSRVERKWTAIVIHHSATENGNAAIFDKWHRENHRWGGVGYDFVIGNGTDSGNGQVEVTFRWRQQLTGAHCKTPNNWANEKAVGICLVGDFNQGVPTGPQMWSLAKLVKFLQNRYRIPKSRIYGHKTTPGARVTDCPGKYFPVAGLKSKLGF
jgi:hypothetical protein